MGQLRLPRHQLWAELDVKKQVAAAGDVYTVVPILSLRPCALGTISLNSLVKAATHNREPGQESRGQGRGSLSWAVVRAEHGL